MAPRGRHLIETKDQKMFIMSLVQKKRIRKHHIHRTTGKGILAYDSNVAALAIELSCPLCSFANGKHHTGHECQF